MLLRRYEKRNVTKAKDVKPDTKKVEDTTVKNDGKNTNKKSNKKAK